MSLRSHSFNTDSTGEVFRKDPSQVTLAIQSSSQSTSMSEESSQFTNYDNIFNNDVFEDSDDDDIQISDSLSKKPPRSKSHSSITEAPNSQKNSLKKYDDPPRKIIV